MSGKRRNPGLIRIICTGSFHKDERGFHRHGFHFVKEMRLLRFEDGSYTINDAHVSSAVFAPVKPAHRVADERVHWFECTCGRDFQRQDRKLMPHVMALYVAAGAPYPGATRIDLDITTI